MQVYIQGFGLFEIKKDKYTDFIKCIKLDMDIFLEIISLSEICIPVLCLNSEEIDSEGMKEFGHIQTEIGVNRVNYLTNHNIINKLD